MMKTSSLSAPSRLFFVFPSVCNTVIKLKIWAMFSLQFHIFTFGQGMLWCATTEANISNILHRLLPWKHRRLESVYIKLRRLSSFWKKLFCQLEQLQLCSLIKPDVTMVEPSYTSSSDPAVCRYVSIVRKVPPEHRARWHILGADCSVGQQEQQEDPGAKDSPVSSSTHGIVSTCGLNLVSVQLHLHFTVVVFAAPGVLCKCSRHPERQQPDQHFHGWQDVLLESGYALSATGSISRELYWKYQSKWYYKVGSIFILQSTHCLL